MLVKQQLQRTYGDDDFEWRWEAFVRARRAFKRAPNRVLLEKLSEFNFDVDAFMDGLLVDSLTVGFDRWKP